MSEIKGQVLGVILVLTLFGVISGVLTAAFNAYKVKIKEETEDLTDIDLSDASFNHEYLTF